MKHNFYKTEMIHKLELKISQFVRAIHLRNQRSQAPLERPPNVGKIIVIKVEQRLRRTRNF